MRLTGRQQQIVRLIAKGRTNKAIAGELGIKLRTVKNHLALVFSCTDTVSRAHLVSQAYQQGYLPLPRRTH